MPHPCHQPQCSDYFACVESASSQAEFRNSVSNSFASRFDRVPSLQFNSNVEIISRKPGGLMRPRCGTDSFAPRHATYQPQTLEQLSTSSIDLKITCFHSLTAGRECRSLAGPSLHPTAIRSTIETHSAAWLPEDSVIVGGSPSQNVNHFPQNLISSRLSPKAGTNSRGKGYAALPIVRRLHNDDGRGTITSKVGTA